MYSKVSGDDVNDAKKIKECLADPEIHTLNVGGIYIYLLFTSLKLTLSITITPRFIRELQFHSVCSSCNK